MIYIVLLSMFVFASVAEIAGIRKITSRFLFIYLVAALILFTGLRFKTGADWSAYIRSFNQSYLPLSEHSWEWGFVLLNKIVYYTVGNYYVVQFMSTVFICIAVYFFIKKYSAWPLASLCLFVSFFFTDILMAQVRQSIALGIILLSTPHILNRKMLRFGMGIAFACMFHISAICAVPLYFLVIRVPKFILIGLVTGSTVFYFFPNILFDMVTALIPFMPGRLGIITEIYLQSVVYSKALEINTGFYFIADILFIIIVLLLVKPTNKNMYFFVNAMAVAFVIHNISTGFMILNRLRAYYFIYGVVGYTGIFSTINFNKLKELLPAYCFLILVFLAVPFIIGYTSNRIHPVTGMPRQHANIPYYNVLYHPPKAEYRKEWNER